MFRRTFPVVGKTELRDKLQNYEKTIEKENKNAYDDEKLSKMDFI